MNKTQIVLEMAKKHNIPVKYIYISDNCVRLSNGRIIDEKSYGTHSVISARDTLGISSEELKEFMSGDMNYMPDNVDFHGLPVLS
jgi:hypothetical protein